MTKFFNLLILSLFCVLIKTQAQPAIPGTQPYGTVDKADLELTSCDFEKDANAEMLFEKGDLYFTGDLTSITEEIHKRIKIFNDNGKDEANIKIPYYSADRLEFITGIQAETINLVDGKIEITKLDKKLIYTKGLDKETSEISFTMPNVKPGSIIEYKYNWNTTFFVDFPDWYFQEKIPVRYNELSTSIPDVFYFRLIPHLHEPYVKIKSSTDARSLMDDGQSYQYVLNNETKAVANVHSLSDEPFMSSFKDNVESFRYQLVSIRPIGGFQKNFSETWAKVGGHLIDSEDFGGQLNRKLDGEEVIIAKAKTFKTDDEKIAYVFNEVKNTMKWNERDSWGTDDGTSRSWINKTGNSTEINLILYHLLKKTGVEVYPMVVSTRDHGKVDPFFTSLMQFNRGVVYVPVDSAKQYILDASGKYNMYNETPDNLLNSSGLYVDKQKNKYDIIRLKRTAPVKEAILINAEIKPGGKLVGNAQLSCISYNRIDAINKYKTDGEKKYTEFLQNGDNALKITSLKMQNMEMDSLPLIQNIDFNADMAGSDENYIYLNSNLFTPFKLNPFLRENRLTNIDFAYPRTYSIIGMYKMPAGYKTDALPKNVSMEMPDKSFTFRRIVGEQEGTILIRYTISYNVAEYSKDHYPDMYEFFKKMYEMLNEQIVLKKGS